MFDEIRWWITGSKSAMRIFTGNLYFKSEDRYRTLFNEARDGIALADLETGELLDCNQALCHMVERTREELIGKAQSILHPQQALVDGQSLNYRRHRSEETALIMEDILLSKTGK